MTGAYEEQLRQSTVQFIAQTATHQWIFVYHNQHGRPRRREQNRIGKSEAEVSNNRRLRSMYSTIEATDYTDRHEASRGLAATAELLVYMFVGARRRFDAPSPVRITEHFWVMPYDRFIFR